MRKSHKRTIGAAACTFAAAGLSLAAHVQFETGAIPTGPEDCDAPDICVPFDWTEILIEVDCTYINGELEKREAPHCEPDTYLVCFDKLNNYLDQDDNGSSKGNGWASGLSGSDCFVENGDGTRSLRLGVTGRPDGLDGVFNGLFQNGLHGQLGCFELCVDFDDGTSYVYTDEFITGAEAFHINYEVPAGASSVDVNIDNTVGHTEVRCDVDFFKLTNLVPLCDYCIEQIGGIDCECRPTDAMLGWFDKSCEQILHDDDSGSGVYAKLCAVADANGDINVGVTGTSDWNFNGLDDALEGSWLDDRALVECPEPKPGHGVAGCYTLKVYVTVPHDGSGMDDTGDAGAIAQMEEAMSYGDLNMDGKTDTADLGVLLGNFGWAGN